MPLSRTLAMISGGASGLGRAAAEHLVKRGGRVLITDMNPEGKAVRTSLPRYSTLHLKGFRFKQTGG